MTLSQTLMHAQTDAAINAVLQWTPKTQQIMMNYEESKCQKTQASSSLVRQEWEIPSVN